MDFLKETGKRWNRLWQCFPPGYDFQREKTAAALLLALPGALSLQYFGKLREAVEMLYYVDADRGRMLRPEAEAVSFLELAGGYAGLFLPYYLFLAAMVFYHYSYYRRDTKSIYLCRRLPQGNFLADSCARAPLSGMAVGAAAEMVLGLLYYWIYLLAMPGECSPRFL